MKSISQHAAAKPYLYETAFLNDSVQNDTSFAKFLALDLGLFKIESGKIIVCDPVQVNKATPIPYDFPKGNFPIQIALGYNKGDNLDSLYYVDYCRIKFSNAKVVEWVLIPYDNGLKRMLPASMAPTYKSAAFSESGILIDKDARADLVKWPFSKWAGFFVDTLNNSERMHWWKLQSFGKHNFVAFSGFNDPSARIYIGLDADKKLCRLLVDTGMFQLPASNY